MSRLFDENHNELEDMKEEIEKAREIVEKFKPFVHWQNDDFYTCPTTTLENAKQCALMHVEGILQVIEVPSYDYKYWQKVKEEIELM